MLDFKKDQKELYQPKNVPSIVKVPKMTFLAVSGKGDPNGEIFTAAVELLYSLSYSIKMNNKAILEYVVPPLEGIWWAGISDAGDSGIGATAVDKSQFEWRIMLRQPDFVTKAVLESAKNAVSKKKKLDVSQAQLEHFSEGLCVQILYTGPYDSEAATIELLEQFANQAGYVFDIADNAEKKLSRRHHEIYLSNPRKVAPEKLKTLIRYPVRKTK
jgi:hypothetical protein